MTIHFTPGEQVKAAIHNRGSPPAGRECLNAATGAWPRNALHTSSSQRVTVEGGGSGHREVPFPSAHP